MYNSTLQNIILLNGIYDILCAFSILRVIYVPFLDKIHISMFNEYDSNLQRILAYWIFTYGMIRLIHYNDFSNGLVSASYCVEAACIFNEGIIYDKIIRPKCIFVTGSCIILSMLCNP